MGEVGTFMLQQTIGSVLCCKCGIPMTPNAANMCARCLRCEVDITEGLQKHVIIIYCPDCGCYLQPPRTWVKAQLESKELLTFCVKRLKNLKNVRLIHAEFIWTEPHSKRVKVGLRIQKEVLNGVVLEQTYVVDYVVQDQMCESCSRVHNNPDQWTAVVQVRQQVAHRRTFFYLEQLILKHEAAVRSIRIKQVDRGIDFFFSNRSHASKLVEFVRDVVPVRSRHDKQLVSHDTKSNSYNYKYTFSVEICPICREDLVCLSPKLAQGGNPIVICTKISNNIVLLDPMTLTERFIDAKEYWRTSFTSLLTSKQLVEFVVLDVKYPTPLVISGSKSAMADVMVARVSDFGKNDTLFYVRTHLGHLLNAGDYALGYDLHAANINIEPDKYNKRLVIPEVVLIKKIYQERRPRCWKLKSLDMEVDARGRGDEEKMNGEYEQFCRDLEENPELRFNISLYQNGEYDQPSEIRDAPCVPLEELLADISLGGEDVEDGMIE